MRERSVGYGRLGTLTHVECVDAAQMRERSVGYGRLGTLTHIERRLGTLTHIERVNAL
jgi:hypothetical protein